MISSIGIAIRFLYLLNGIFLRWSDGTWICYCLVISPSDKFFLKVNERMFPILKLWAFIRPKKELYCFRTFLKIHHLRISSDPFTSTTTCVKKWTYDRKLFFFPYVIPLWVVIISSFLFRVVK